MNSMVEKRDGPGYLPLLYMDISCGRTDLNSQCFSTLQQGDNLSRLFSLCPSVAMYKLPGGSVESWRESRRSKSQPAARLPKGHFV